MIDFDGDNLIITLAPGVTEVEVQDIYEDWKRWLLLRPKNRSYPSAFTPLGGEPLSSIINVGSYFFLNNVSGWRIKPPEENITIFLTGNLAALDTAIPLGIPTTGAFTAFIIGLQPVTQGVTPSMQDQLEHSTFNEQVIVDVGGLNSIPGTAYPAGTLRTPCDNVIDALAIAVFNSLGQITFMSDTTLTEDFSDGYLLKASTPFIVINAAPAADLTTNRFQNMTIMGALDGLNEISDCWMGVCTGVNGVIKNTALLSQITLSNDTLMISCLSNVEGGGSPVIVCVAGVILEVRDFKGSLKIEGIVDGDHTVSISSGGQITIGTTCTGGTIHVRGVPYKISDNSGIGCTVLIETEGSKLDEIYKIHGLSLGKPLINTPTLRTVNGIKQNITGDGISLSVVTREDLTQFLIVDELGNFVVDESGNNIVGN